MKSTVLLGSVLTCVVLLASACASSEKVATADNANKVCERSYRTGSNMPVKDCQAPTSDEERQQMIQQTRDAAMRSLAPTKPGG